MSRLSYRQRADVYRKGLAEASPEDWILSTPDLAIAFRQMTPGQVLATGALYNPAPTHTGRCAYHTDVQAGRDRRLLVDTETGDQYEVLAIQEGRHLRGGRGELSLVLHRVDPPNVNLAVS